MDENSYRDTITMPTDEMFDLMRHASRGDDVYGEDQATNDLQDKIAKMAGKEAGLFCVSGTMVSLAHEHSAHSNRRNRARRALIVPLPPCRPTNSRSGPT